MASACALAIFSGKIIFISRLSRSAERSKRIFTGGSWRKTAFAAPLSAKARRCGRAPAPRGELSRSD